jgi:hypothetical protein
VRVRVVGVVAVGVVAVGVSVRIGGVGHGVKGMPQGEVRVKRVSGLRGAGPARPWRLGLRRRGILSGRGGSGLVLV